MKDNQKTKKQLIDELDMLRLKVAALEIAGSLRDASKAQQEDNAAKPKREEGRSFQEEKLNFIIEEAGLTSWEWDIEHDRKVFNAIWAEKLGYTLEEFNSALQEFSLDYFQHPEDIPAAQQAMKDCLTGKTSIYRAEYRMRTKTGDWKWMLALGKIIERNAEGKPTHMTGVNLDISERKQAEEALRESEARYRVLLEAIPDKIIHYRKDGTHLAVKMPSDYIATTQYDLDNHPNITQIDPELAPRVLSCLQQAAETGKTQVLEYEAMRGDEKEYREARYTAINQDEIVAIIRDITGRKRAEEALRQSEVRFRTLVENIPGEVYRCLPTPPWRLIHNSAKNETITGYPVRDFLEGSLLYSDFILSEDLEMVNSALEAGIACKLPYVIEYRLRHSYGSIHWVAERGRAVYSEQGEPLWLDGVIFDITERKRLEQELIDEERSYRTLVENVPGAVYRCEPVPPWRTIHISSEIEVISGFPVRDFLDNTILFDNFEFPEDIEMVNRAILTGIADKKPYVIEYRVRHVDGSIRWLYEKGRAIYSEQGQPLWLDGVFLDITERKRAEQALQQANERLQATLNALPDLMFEVDREGRVYDYRAPYKDLLYVSPEVFLGKTVSQVLPKEAAEIINHAIAQAVEEGWHRGATYSLETPAGLNWFELSIASKGDPKAPDGRLIVLAHDITERKLAEQALLESEGHYHLVTDNTADAIWLMDMNLKTTYTSPSAVRMRGYTLEELNAMTLDQHMTPASLNIVLQALGEELTPEKLVLPDLQISRTMELEYYRKDGSVFWGECTFTLVRDGAGNPIGILGVGRDITERKRVEDALRESERSYRTLVENIPGAVYRTEPNRPWRAIHISNEIEAISGYPARDFMDGPVRCYGDIELPEDTERSARIIETGIASKRPYIIESRIRHADGSIRWVYEQGRAVYSEQGEPLWLDGVIFDITERKRAEEALRESEERFRTLVENIPGAVYRCEPTPPWRTIHLSRGIEAISGFPLRDFLDNTILFDALEFPEDKEMVNRALLTAVAETKTYTIEYRISHGDGSIRWVYEKGRAIYSEQGQPLWLDGVFLDITERKRAEEALREAQKLASMGSLAAGMAHEINSPLQVINGLSERITRQLENSQLDEGKLKRDIATVNRCGWNIANIIRSLLTYARESPGQVASHNLNEIVNDTLLLTEHQLKTVSNISVLSDLGRNLPPLSCERTQIVQVLINLLTNARDAMPNGGEVTIRTGYNAKQNRFTLQVSDTGTGIPKEMQEKIFDPFFTTKEVGQGTGLGLSIVLGIVKSHGGDIKVESAPKQGTTFTIYLPKEPIQKPDSEPLAENRGRY
ncbi:MAG: PAS domain S-box protein [Anaerolineales bacterium]|nr:PAS domain S-box protein [Anaerolineales bacterium]